MPLLYFKAAALFAHTMCNVLPLSASASTVTFKRSYVSPLLCTKWNLTLCKDFTHSNLSLTSFSYGVWINAKEGPRVLRLGPLHSSLGPTSLLTCLPWLNKTSLKSMLLIHKTIGTERDRWWKKGVKTFKQYPICFLPISSVAFSHPLIIILVIV